MKTFTRILAIPFVCACCAFSFVEWLWRIVRNKRFEDKRHFHHVFGWLSPSMEDHWQRFWARLLGREWPWPEEYLGSRGNWYHAGKNVPVEWVRLNAERVAKGGSFLVFVLIVVAIAGWVL